MKKQLLFYFIILCSVISAYADRRNYVWTYQYVTIPEAQTELEFYQTTKLNNLDSWEYRIEVEHGLTDNWDFSVYQIFNQQEDQALSWEAVQFRTRYRFGEEGKYILDPLLYMEYNRKLDLDKPNKFEVKLILAKTKAKLNLAVNPVYELFISPGIEHEAGLDMGISWEFSPKFIAGLESTSRFEFKDNKTEKSNYLGPSISFASGNWWYTLGSAWGTTKNSDKLRIRFIMGVGL